MEEGGDENEEKEQDPRRIFERVCGGVDGSVQVVAQLFLTNAESFCAPDGYLTLG